MSGFHQEFSIDDLKRYAAGNRMSKMLEIALDLDLFSKLQGQLASIEEVATLWSMPPSSARLLCQFLTNMGLLCYQQDRLSNHQFCSLYAQESVLCRAGDRKGK